MPKRRHLLQALGASGLLFYLPWRAHADPIPYNGKFFLHIHARGGWDPTLLCDARLAGDSDGQYENDLVQAVSTEHGITFPSVLKDGATHYETSEKPAMALASPQKFFSDFGGQFVAINGVDTETILHGAGIQQMICGHIARPLPALAALFAATQAKSASLPVAFLGGGTYNVTGGLVGVSHLSSAVKEVIDPYRLNDNSKIDLLTPDEVKLVKAARLARIQQLSTTTSQREKQALEIYQQANAKVSDVGALSDVLASTEALFPSKSSPLSLDTWAAKTGFTTDSQTAPYFNDQERRSTMFRDLDLILTSFQQGTSAAANYESGIDDENPTFDTHSEHDRFQQHAMGALIARLQYVLQRAAQLQIAQRLFVVVSSDFGRTPRYSGALKGKDHWPTSSVLIAGPGITGGRTRGGSDVALRPMLASEGDASVGSCLSAADLASKLGISASEAAKRKEAQIGGTWYTRIRPSHVHRALRHKLGIDDDFALASPLPQDKLAFTKLLDD